MKINWTLVAQIVAAVAGVVGTVVTPIWGSQVASSVQDFLQALSGVLVLIPTLTAAVVHVAKAKAKLALGR